MRLEPSHPPGRVTRKARDFEQEIARLRGEGYTLDAIRAALANAGVHVSISTVRREVARASGPPPPARSNGSPAIAASPVLNTASESPASSTGASLSTRRNGKEVAEVFMRDRITNPLIRSKEPR